MDQLRNRVLQNSGIATQAQVLSLKDALNLQDQRIKLIREQTTQLVATTVALNEAFEKEYDIVKMLHDGQELTKEQIVVTNSIVNGQNENTRQRLDQISGSQQNIYERLQKLEAEMEQINKNK